MSERLNKCPKCKSTNLIVIKIHNPETHDLNANATLECEDCKNIYKDRVPSPYYKEEYNRGFVI